ncbi:MAG: sialidase family protein [Bacteroidota bacterium]
MNYSFALLLYLVGSSIPIYPQQHLSADVQFVSNTSIFPQGTFAACHASTIVEVAPGVMMAAWFAGSYEGANDVGIWISSFQDNQWSNPVEIVTGKDSVGTRQACWNPVLFKSKKNTLFLFYKVGLNPREWRGMVVQSFDNGDHWTHPQELPKGFLGPIKNKPIQLSNGDILCPSSVESIDAKNWTVHLEITNEKLSSWKKVFIESDSTVGVIQPSIITHPDGKLQMLCRSRQNEIYNTWSADNGVHWSAVQPLSLPNPNSGIDEVSLADGSFMLVYNPLTQGNDWYFGRNVLRVAVSLNGEDWKDICQLENEKEGEFSYPAIIQAADNTIHITYTAQRQNIKHVILRLIE